MLSSNATFLFRVSVFPECCAWGRWPSPCAGLPRVPCPLGNRGRPPSPSAILPRVQHSGESVALGKDCFSRSAPRRATPHRRQASQTWLGGGRLGFEVQADGGDLRHPCLGAHCAHPGGASAVGRQPRAWSVRRPLPHGVVTREKNREGERETGMGG
jgi:hypothetical protein